MTVETGKLLCITEGSRKKKRQVIYLECQSVKKPKLVKVPVTDDWLSNALLEQQQKSLDSLNNIDVEFKRNDNNDPFQIWELGQQWDRVQTEVLTPAETRSRPENHLKVVSPDKFHNPYNFVPALPRDGVKGELGDREPKGHGRYRPNRWTGRIAVKLTTVTPLLIPDAAEMTEDENGHKTFPVRIGADGKPYLPPTSIKGMLRSAYEAVTNSRLSVFESHDARLAYRLPAKKGTSVIPARVERRADGLYLNLLEAANLPRYDNNGRISTRLKYPSPGKPPQHGEHVFVKVERSQNGIKKVTAIQPWKAEGPPSTNWHTGWVLITNANISKKKNERVFIEGRNHSAIKINKRIAELWENLISDYQKEHEKELGKRKEDKIPFDKYLGRDPGKTAWSRHIYDKEQLALKEGILCYVALEEGCDVSGEIDPSDVVALQPVTISRRLYDQKPVDLLPATLRPATDKNSLSPADRVFGWVNQKGKGSYKGHLRVHSVECLSPQDQALSVFGNPGVPLAILGQPKPAQTRFYTAEDKRCTPIQAGKDKAYGYEHKKRGLRGRKVYPHHQGLPENYWQNPQEDLTSQEIDGHYQVYRRPSGPEERDSQNRSITGWVNPGTSFQFEIDVNNLSPVELGALLWLLKLPEPYHHRLGGGKPLGFGSVRLDADFKGADIRTGQAWETFYRSLHSEEKPLFEHSACIAEYQTAVETAYKDSFNAVPFIAAFCRAAQGFEDGVPIHYPWNPETNGKPDPEGENFKWFTDNEQGDRWSLPSLTSGKALPLKPRTTEKSPQGNDPASPALERATSGAKSLTKKEQPQKPTRRP